MSELFTASRAGRHMACHASTDLAAAIPNWTPPEDPSGAAAKSGTNKHEILEKIWELTPQEIQQMIDAQQYVVDLLKGRRFKRCVEQKFTATWLKSTPSTTPDLVLYTAKEIHVIDTKMGKVPVEVVENEQLMYYAVCVAHLAPLAKGVTVHIVQPAAGNMASWFVDTNRLKQFMEDAIAHEAEIAAGDLTFGPSDHCKFCPANPHSRAPKGHPMCPAMMQLLYPRVQLDEQEILNG